MKTAPGLIDRPPTNKSIGSKNREPYYNTPARNRKNWDWFWFAIAIVAAIGVCAILNVDEKRIQEKHKVPKTSNDSTPMPYPAEMGFSP